MREITRFLGMSCFFCDDLASGPHFHVSYNQYNGTVDGEKFAIIGGNLPPRVAGLAVEWAAKNQQMIKDNWEILQKGGANLMQIPALVE